MSYKGLSVATKGFLVYVFQTILIQNQGICVIRAVAYE